MVKKSNSKSQNRGGSRTSVKVGNISRVSGKVNIAGGNIRTSETTTGLSVVDVKQLFEYIYAQIEADSKLPPVAKADVEAEVKDLQTGVMASVEQQAPLTESFLARRFRNIARVAPDILDVVVATLGSPLAGLGVAVKKIAEKAKAEAAPA